MRVIHVLRKPLSEKTVAANVLKHGTGAINVDACRSTIDADDPQFRLSGRTHLENRIYGDLSSKPPSVSDPHDRSVRHNSKGRWPSNLILEHDPACRCVGSWDCVEGCPVASLDDQSGVAGAKAPVRGTEARRTEASPGVGAGYVYSAQGRVPGPFHNDRGRGGASRFFKQVGGQKP